MAPKRDKLMGAVFSQNVLTGEKSPHTAWLEENPPVPGVDPAHQLSPPAWVLRAEYKFQMDAREAYKRKHELYDLMDWQ